MSAIVIVGATMTFTLLELYPTPCSCSSTPFPKRGRDHNPVSQPANPSYLPPTPLYPEIIPLPTLSLLSPRLELYHPTQRQAIPQHHLLLLQTSHTSSSSPYIAPGAHNPYTVSDRLFSAGLSSCMSRRDTVLLDLRVLRWRRRSWSLEAGGWVGRRLRATWS